jgi:hypothetical protein
MRARADFLGFVARTHLEFDATTVDLGDFGLRRDAVADGSRGEMMDVDGRADRAFAGFEIVAHGIERGVLHRRHQHRRGEDRRQRRVLELIGEVRRRHPQRERPLGSDRNGAHVVGLTIFGAEILAEKRFARLVLHEPGRRTWLIAGASTASTTPHNAIGAKANAPLPVASQDSPLIIGTITAQL